MRPPAVICLIALSGACTGDDPLPQTTYDDAAGDAGRLDARLDIGRDMPADMPARDLGPEQDATTADANVDATQPVDADSSFAFQLGHSDPFVSWSAGDDLPVVAGFQGGYHTEHIVRLDPDLTRSDIADAFIRVTLSDTGSTQLAGGSWLFDPTQWATTNEGHHASIPPVVFGDEPVYDSEVELSGEAELTDGRTAEFRVVVTLVPADR